MECLKSARRHSLARPLEKYTKLKGQSIVIKITSHQNQVLNVIKLTITTKSSSKSTQNEIHQKKTKSSSTSKENKLHRKEGEEQKK
jgi:hypothetical protein